MAATQKIQLKRSLTSASAPTSGQIDYGELAINTADGVIYFKHAAAATNTALNDAIGQFKYYKNNDAGTAPPTANDDAADGYSVGSRWIDTTNDEVYICVDATIASAIWVHSSPSEELTSHIGLTNNPHSVTKSQVGLSNVENLKVYLNAPADPTINDDAAAGYVVGSRWINVSSTPRKELVLVDSTNGAAVWRETTKFYPNGYAIDDAIATAPVATGDDAIAIGDGASATGAKSFALGVGAVASRTNEVVLGLGNFGTASDTINGTIGLRIFTTTASPEEMTTASSGYLTIPTDSTVMFRAYITARRTDTDNESAAYVLEGCIDNNAGTTAIVGAVSKIIYAEDTVAWDVNATADDTNDRLAILVTGSTANIRWFARVEYTQITG